MAFEHSGPEELRIIPRARSQRFHRKIAQRSAQPIMRRDIEADLRPLQHGLRQLLAHQLLQNNFLPRA